MVEPLQQFLGSAQSTAMVLHNDHSCEVVRVFIDQMCAGLTIVECNLPKGVQVPVSSGSREGGDRGRRAGRWVRVRSPSQVVEVRRAKAAIILRAMTKVQFDDEIMLCGRATCLAGVTGIKKGKVTLLRLPPVKQVSRGHPSLEDTTALYQVRFTPALRRVCRKRRSS